MNIFLLGTFVFVAVIPVVLNRGENDYEYYDQMDDYIPGYSQSHWHRRPQRGIRSFKADLKGHPKSVTKPGMKARSGGIIGTISDAVQGIIAGGNCLVQCAVKLVTNCNDLITCIWNCFFPDKPLSRSVRARSEDTDIKMRGWDTSAIDMTVKDIVNIFECLANCLTRYLPRSLQTLQEWLNCMTTRCICVGFTPFKQ